MTARNVEQHKCECKGWPDCILHGAQEYGGGEPDVCEPHTHLPGAATPEEAAARRAIAAVLDGLPQRQQQRVVERVIADLKP